MRDHIFAVAKYLSEGWGPFGGGNPVVAFDVVNEAVADDDSFDDGLRRNEWYRILGEDYIELAFRYADEAFNGTYAAPGADRPVTLFINDYQTENPAKRARYLALVDRLLASGVPVDGIGHQFHVTGATSVDDLGAALDDAGGRGLVQAVTELDVPTGRPESPGRLLEQGYFYRDAFRVFREHDDELFSVTVWGLYDARSWRRGEGAPLIFDEGLRAKPAYYGIVDGYDGEEVLGPLPPGATPSTWLYAAGSGLRGSTRGGEVARRRRGRGRGAGSRSPVGRSQAWRGRGAATLTRKPPPNGR